MRAFRAIHAKMQLPAVMLTLFVGASHAATPNLINYQGSLATSGGAPVPDASYSVLFAIYSAPSGGSTIWNETQSVTTTGGRFAVLLGSITPIAEALFSDTVRYLGITVGSDPEMTPRARLVTVPYSFRVSTIDGSTGGSVTGNINLDFSSPSSGNILKGGSLFLHDYGPNNIFAGISAGNLGVFGARNSGFGELALNLLDFGQGNSAFGYSALRVLSSGSNNTAVGAYALELSPAGSNNTALGAFTLMNSLSGPNTAIGVGALSSATLGSQNTAVGADALLRLADADDNTAVGHESLAHNVSSNANSAHGSFALHYATSGYNSANGYFALYNTTTGGENTAMGAAALGGNTTGFGNTAVGRMALLTNTIGNFNTSIGFSADQSTNGLNNATAIGAFAVVNASNKIRLGSPSVSVIEGSVAYTFTSDENQKENFQSVDGEDVLKKIAGLSATSWNYKGQDPTQFRHYGPMAQEFYAAFGHDGVGASGTPTTINSGDMAGVMLIAIQTLEKRTAEVETLKQTVTVLQEELAALKKESMKK